MGNRSEGWKVKCKLEFWKILAREGPGSEGKGGERGIQQSSYFIWAVLSFLHSLSFAADVANGSHVLQSWVP